MPTQTAIGSSAQRVRDDEAGAHALLLLRRELGLGGAAGLALLDEGGDLRVACCAACSASGCSGATAQKVTPMIVSARVVKTYMPAVLDQLAVAAADLVREGEAHALALADPVLLHQPHALGPAAAARCLHVLEQLVGVLRDLQVVAGDLALLDQRAGAPAAAVDHLLVGEHGLVDRVPVDDLGAALGDARFEHLQEQPLVPLVVARASRSRPRGSSRSPGPSPASAPSCAAMLS